MPEYVQTTKRSRQRDIDAETEAVDLTDAQLDEDVSCCLADIDSALESNDAEQAIMEARRQRDRAAAEKDFFANYSKATRHSAWAEKYAHLGAYMREGHCCERPAFRDD